MNRKDDEYRGSHPLHRKLRRHWAWKDKPFNKGAALVDLILRATFNYGKIEVGGKIIELHTGQIFVSEHNLASDWGWHRKKVRRFFSTMEKDDMIIQRTIKLSKHPSDPDAGKSIGKVLTLLNYERLHKEAFKKQEKELKKEK